MHSLHSTTATSAGSSNGIARTTRADSYVGAPAPGRRRRRRRSNNVASVYGLFIICLPAIALGWTSGGGRGGGRGGIVGGTGSIGGTSVLAASTMSSPMTARRRLAPQKGRPGGVGLRLSSSTPATSSDGEKKRTSDPASNENGGDAAAASDRGTYLSKLLSVDNVSVMAVLASAFLNLLGFTMAGPITPSLGRHFNLEVGASFGSLTSAYPFGMLLGLFLWPQLSDRIGRKPVITASLLGSGLGLLGQAFVISRGMSLGWFLASRAFTGAFAGSSPVSKAYLADLGDATGKLPRYLAWRDAASTGAFIAGPLLGGLMYDIRRRMIGVGSDVAKTELLNTAGSLAYVIGVSAVASLLAAILVSAFVQDEKSVVRRLKRKKSDAGGSLRSSSNSEEDSNEDIGKDDDNDHFLVSCPLGTRMWTGVVSVCIVSFLFNVGDSTFHAFFSAVLRNAGLSAKDIGLLYTVLACVSFSVSAGGASKIIRKFGPVATCAAGMSCIGTGLLAMGAAASTGGGWFATLLPPTFVVLATAATTYYCGVPLYGPTIPTMLLRCVPPTRRGFIMGLDGTVNTIGRIISPLLMGDIYRRYGAGAAFGLAGGAVFFGAVTTLYRRFAVLRGLERSGQQTTA